MAFLRILLVLLISLALPAQALADVMATAPSCPMTEEAASVETAAASHDCCEDEDDHGTRCASDLSCKCGGGHPAISTRAFVPPLPAIFQTHATTPMWPQSIFAIALWRPPTPPSPLS
jgi:hypothetical protein